MMKVLYYVLYGIIAILGLYYVGSSLFGRFILWDANPLVAKIVLLAATIVAARLLYWAYQLGDLQNKWLAGTGAVLLAFLAFQSIILLGAFLFGRK